MCGSNKGYIFLDYVLVYVLSALLTIPVDSRAFCQLQKPTNIRTNAVYWSPRLLLRLTDDQSNSKKNASNNVWGCLFVVLLALWSRNGDESSRGSRREVLLRPRL